MGGIKENNKTDTLIEGASIGLKRNMALGKCLEIHKDDPTRNQGSSGEATVVALPL